MKDYSKIEEYEGVKYYLNENGQWHRLTGPAIEYYDGCKSYYINGICYMYFDKNNNELYIYPYILKLNLEYEKYIKQNIKDLISEHNPKIELSQYFKKEEISQLPNWLKDFIML